MNPPIHSAQRSWEALLIRGVLAIVFGIIVLAFPGIALLALIIVFGVYALIDGALAVVTAIQERNVLPRWGWLLVEGIAGIILGIVALVWPGETALILLYIVAAWAIITGVIEIGASFTARNGLMGIAGALSIIFGVLLYARPGVGLLSLLWLLGAYAIVFGILFVVHAIQMRSNVHAMSDDNRIGGMNA